MPQTMRVATMGGKTGTVPSFPERDNKTGATGQLFKDLSGIVGEERAAELYGAGSSSGGDTSAPGISSSSATSAA